VTVPFQPRFELQSPYVGDYFGLWMIEPTWFANAAQRMNGANLHLHLQSAEVQQAVSNRDSRTYPVSEDGIAGFVAEGPMMKAVPSMADGTSYVRLRQQLSNARRDQSVKGGLLIMDTPGGTAKGNEDVAAEVAKFAAEKPLFVFVEDMTASAGVSIASNATKRFANNATAFYGAMGTYGVIQDMSGMAENLGIKVHVIRAGNFKGMGTAGTEVTEEQLQELQREVNRLNDAYLATIARGLGKSVDSIRELADGRVIFASDAVSAGLINGVQSLEETTNELRAMVASRSQKQFHVNRSKTAMADKTPATLQELKSTFPNSSAEWRETQLEAGNDIGQAAIAYAQHVEAAAAKQRDDHAKQLEEAKAARPSITTGHQPLTAANVNDGSDIDSGDAVADFQSAVRARLPKGREATYEERMSAVSYVARTRPDLHQAFIIATNSDKGARVKRLVQEKYEAVA